MHDAHRERVCGCRPASSAVGRPALEAADTRLPNRRTRSRRGCGRGVSAEKSGLRLGTRYPPSFDAARIASMLMAQARRSGRSARRRRSDLSRRQGRPQQVRQDLGHATWSVGGRELCQPRTQADGKPVTESNLTLRSCAQVAAVIWSPNLGCLRCKRRGSRVSARTRYLECVFAVAAVSAGGALLWCCPSFGLLDDFCCERL